VNLPVVVLFCLKTFLRNTNSTCRLSPSQRALALCSSVESTVCLLDGWRWDLALRQSLEWASLRYTVAQRAVRSPLSIYFQEREMALPFGLHGELNARWMLLRWFRNSFSLSGPCGQMTKVSAYQDQQRGCWRANSTATFSKSSM
jgi:hypothetical protein